MSDTQKMALFSSMQQGQSDPWSATPRTNGMGLIAQGTDPQALPPPVARMQGGFGLNPQMMGLLQQVSKMPPAAPMQQASPFAMRPQSVQQAARLPYGPGNWSR